MYESQFIYVSLLNVGFLQLVNPTGISQNSNNIQSLFHYTLYTDDKDTITTIYKTCDKTVYAPSSFSFSCRLSVLYFSMKEELVGTRILAFKTVSKKTVFVFAYGKSGQFHFKVTRIVE